MKSIRSAPHILFRCSIGPFNIPKLPINVSEPQVKESANFCGLIAIIGNPTKNANAKNNADRKSSAQNTCNHVNEEISNRAVLLARDASNKPLYRIEMCGKDR